MKKVASGGKSDSLLKKSVMFPRDTWKRLKIYSAESEVGLSEVVVLAVEQHLAGAKKQRVA
jgi:hypothetical protein